tara:strand:- start:649 stop:2535 length:1887 start_codon:yes stop_codon:yes gene_type:complete
MENFVVSARKYRPATFDTVVGQASITNTLKNAIKTSHLAQAFLFCGPRGVGKTTCARILAKTINCFNRTEKIEACDECDSCNSFNEGASLNILELDAASNNSVDDIRNLIDQVRFAPQIGSHKVYIIDEVHMLTTQAFNAFLKTLEEPPPHAIFILATTEKHKIIPTILSRCQIFDFNRITVDDIASHLLSIAEKEGIDAEEEALHLIAEKADGALRDALSIFDQLVSFSGKKLSYDAVVENLNILDYDYYFKATDFILEGKIPDILVLFNTILQKGFDGHLLINGLAAHFRNLLVGKDPQTINLLEVGKSIKARYLEQSKKCDLSFLLAALDICRKADVQYQGSRNKRLLIEITLMQLASINSEQKEAEKKKPYLKSADLDESSIVLEEQPKPLQQDIKKVVQEPRAELQKEEKTIEKEVENNPEPEQAAITSTKEEELQKERSETEISQEKIPVEKPELKGRLALLAAKKAKTSALSIQHLTKEEEETEERKTQVEYKSELREPFTKEEFIACWKKLSKKIQKENAEGSSIVISAMKTYEPELLADFKVKIKVDNRSQLEEINIKRTDLHEFLRKTLKNGGIELEFEIQKNADLKKAYTDEEKFREMAKKNPHLNALKQELGFDFL